MFPPFGSFSLVGWNGVAPVPSLGGTAWFKAVPDAEVKALLEGPKPPVVPDPPWPKRVEPVFEPNAGLFV